MFETSHTPEDRLARVEKMVEEIHSMLRAERRSRRISSLIRTAYWGLFIYASWWSWVNYAQPMITQLSATLQQVQDVQKNLTDTTSKVSTGINDATSGVDLSKIQELLKGLKK